MSTLGVGALAFFGGLFVGAVVLRATNTWCCDQVAKGARDKIAGAAGSAGGLVSSALDATGLTDLLPGIVQAAGLGK